VSRADRQIKLRGNRVEPGEVESVLLRHPNVQQVAVTVHPDASGSNSLAAYVVPRHSPLVVDDSPGDRWDSRLRLANSVPPLRNFVAAALPEYMVPSAFVELQSLPQTLSGKLDLKALPKSAAAAYRPSFISPRNSLEVRLARIWEATLR